MYLCRRFEEWETGDELKPVIKKMTQEKINKYVSTAEDYNPIHVDIEYAKKTPFKSTIAPGYQCMAYFSEMMSRDFGEGWYIGGTMELRLVKPVKPGDLLNTVGRVVEKKEEAQGNRVICEIRMTNQNGEDVMTGTASALCK